MEQQKILKLKRVPYGKKDTLDENKEYQLADESMFGPVGTRKDWQEMFPEAKLEIVENESRVL